MSAHSYYLQRLDKVERRDACPPAWSACLPDYLDLPIAASYFLRLLLPALPPAPVPWFSALQVRGLEPYVVHMTWTYNGISGKRSRLRDMGLWIDPPEYYGAGAGAGAGGAGNDSSSFVTVDITLPEVGGRVLHVTLCVSVGGDVDSTSVCMPAAQGGPGRAAILEASSRNQHSTISHTLPCYARCARCCACCVQTPAAFNEWNENEDMISFYLASIHAQLQQAYVGLALALSAGRPFVLPKVRV